MQKPAQRSQKKKGGVSKVCASSSVISASVLEKGAKSAAPTSPKCGGGMVIGTRQTLYIEHEKAIGPTAALVAAGSGAVL